MMFIFVEACVAAIIMFISSYMRKVWKFYLGSKLLSHAIFWIFQIEIFEPQSLQLHILIILFSSMLCLIAVLKLDLDIRKTQHKN